MPAAINNRGCHGKSEWKTRKENSEIKKIIGIYARRNVGTGRNQPYTHGSYGTGAENTLSENPGEAGARLKSFCERLIRLRKAALAKKTVTNIYKC